MAERKLHAGDHTALVGCNNSHCQPPETLVSDNIVTVSSVMLMADEGAHSRPVAA